MIAFINYNWTMHGTPMELEAKIGFGFVCKPGWIETTTDTVLTVPSPGMPASHFNIYVWNQPGIMMEFAKLLGLPVHQGKERRT